MNNNGYGKKLSLSTAQQIAFPEAMRRCEVRNSGSADIYVSANCSLAEFADIVTAATYVPIPASSSFTFESVAEGKSLSSICLEASTSTQTVYVQAY